MARPKKYRTIEYFLKAAEFVPQNPTDTVEISMDEMEAMRLADLEGMHQIDIAKLMDISRPTVGRILDSAHKKIADALLNSKRIKIGEFGKCRVVKLMKCDNCGKVWRTPTDYKGGECPYCHTEHIHTLETKGSE
jgi:predicted DNA-binding protein (UPF0251 family)|uniref:DUF134 domain-containing protein n=1 Tax=Mesoaciditoga lauensis TaxID=1495039 RepID=A0A7V3REH7_9BACT